MDQSEWMPFGIHEQEIQTHDPHHAVHIKENACSTIFASKIQTHIFNTPAYRTAGS